MPVTPSPVPPVVPPVRTEAVGLLAAGLAHDLNNMLGAIVATTELVAARLPRGGENARDLAAIAEQATRAGALIHQLLAFSRQETLKPVRTSFGEIVAALGPTLVALAGRQAVLDMAGMLTEVPIRADRVALERVIINLVLNARDAVAAQGRIGRVRIETGRANGRHVPAGAGFMPFADYGWLSVSDDGPGVPAENAARIFEPYFTTRTGGQGLGLATAYGIVKQSGGYLLLDNGPLGGARFTIYLPDEGKARQPAVVRQAPLQAPMLLLAEDESLLRLSAARALETAGFRVVQAASGEEALARFAEHPEIAALVSDIRLGGMDGIALAQALRAERPELPVLLISGYADAAAREAVAALDFAFLAKPFGLQALTEEIDALLR